MIFHPYIFAISYCLIFFNPLHLANEIWPFFIFGILIKGSINIQHLLITILYLIISISASLIFNFLPLIDIIQFSLVIITCSYVLGLPENEIEIICKIFKFFIFLSLLMGICQFNVPGLQNLTYDFFSGRPSLAEHLINDRKVVTLFSPEPSYASAHILSMFLFLAVNNKANKYQLITFIILMLMVRSLSTILILPFLVVFLTQIGTLKLRYVLMSIAFIFALILSLSDILEIYFWRLSDFYELLVETNSILKAEQYLGSTRISQIYSTVFTLIPDYFKKPYSFLGLLNMTSMLPFSWFVICLLLVLYKSTFLIISATIILALSGPVLLTLVPASFLLAIIKRK